MNYSTTRLAWLALIATVIAAVIWPTLERDPYVPFKTQILDDRVSPSPFYLGRLTLAPDGHVWGALDNRLYRIIDEGRSTEFIHQFTDPVNGIHVMVDGSIIVATDRDWFNPETPCRIYISRNGGQSFELIKVLPAASAIWWSIASDSANTLYIGEYGPKEKGLSDKVWRSDDFGQTWTIIFRLPYRNSTHIHRVAVDPYTDALWITHGDTVRGIHVSRDRGKTWQLKRLSKPTGVAFTADAIYWGEDSDPGVVTRYDRKWTTFSEVFNATDRGPYGGSIYALNTGSNDSLYAGLIKYANENHPATLWKREQGQWKLLMTFDNTPGTAGGINTMAGPDRFGLVYFPGYQIRDEIRQVMPE